MATVRLEKIVKRYGKNAIVDGLDLEAKTNQLTVFVGPSGCGKSTLLRIIAGLERIDSGRVLVDGEDVNDVPPFHRGVAMVFQSYALYPHMTVYENLRFGLTSLKLDKAEIDRRIRTTAEKLQLASYLDRKPRQLSGGQRQRVAMGRAMVRHPRVFLFDEPLSNLDAALRAKMRLEIAKLRRELDATAIYVTHDQVEAMTLADKLVVLRGGKVEQQGAPMDVYRSPVNKFVAGFLGSPTMNFVPVRAVDGRVDVPGGGRVGYEGLGVPAELGIRPEQLTLRSDAKCRLRATVDAVEHLGDQALVYLSLPEAPEAGQVVARFLADEPLPASKELELGFDPAALVPFDREGRALPGTIVPA
jgi:ABC-type sugar transport system ATPase subunit